MSNTPITSSGPTISLTAEDDLLAAYKELSQTEGGGTIELAPGEYSIWIYQYGSEDGANPVVITSADPEDPAQFSSAYIRDVYNLRLDNLLFNSNDSSSDQEVYVKDSTGIQITNSTFVYDADNSLKDSGEVAKNGVWVRDSSDVLFQDNYLQGYFHAITVTNTTNADVDGNELTEIQGDGFRGGGLQDSAISNNYMHDFYGSLQSLNHSDMIQIWGANSYLLTENLEITGNTLIADDEASQTIFIRNEEFGKEGDSTSGYYQNITISDNLIYNAHLWGIRVDDTDGLQIENNTLLHATDASLEVNGGDERAWAPIIYTEKNNLDVSVTDNIAKDIKLGEDHFASGNILWSNDPDSENYVGDHFVDPFGGGRTPEDLQMVEGSSFEGAGILDGETRVESEGPSVEPSIVVPEVEPVIVIDTDDTDDGPQAPDAPLARGRDDDDGGNFLSKIFAMIFGIFGLGKDDDDGDVVVASDEAGYMLSTIVPETGTLDDMMPDGDDGEDEEDEFADAA